MAHHRHAADTAVPSKAARPKLLEKAAARLEVSFFRSTFGKFGNVQRQIRVGVQKIQHVNPFRRFSHDDEMLPLAIVG